MDQIWEKVTGLDLKSVRNKFAAKKSWWWHLGHDPARIENEYRQFLYLLASNPEKMVAPWSTDLDEFWRGHINDTRKYAADCNAVAGRMIHCSPPSSKAYTQTRKLYLASFGESARKARRTAGGDDLGSYSLVFSDRGSSHHHGGGHHAGHHDAGHSGGGHHSCGGHSGCGGHGH
jgi:hypothetical protein